MKVLPQLTSPGSGLILHSCRFWGSIHTLPKCSHLNLDLVPVLDDTNPQRILPPSSDLICNPTECPSPAWIANSSRTQVCQSQNHWRYSEHLSTLPRWVVLNRCCLVKFPHLLRQTNHAKCFWFVWEEGRFLLCVSSGYGEDWLVNVSNLTNWHWLL